MVTPRPSPPRARVWRHLAGVALSFLGILPFLYYSAVSARASTRSKTGRPAQKGTGTNVPPYMVARGRQPSLPSDLGRFELGDALPTLPALSDHLKELTGHMKLASRLLREARERTLARSRAAFHEHQVHTQFEPGERVLLWKRVAIRRKVGSDEISSQLKIFNTVYSGESTGQQLYYP